MTPADAFVVADLSATGLIFTGMRYWAASRGLLDSRLSLPRKTGTRAAQTGEPTVKNLSVPPGVKLTTRQVSALLGIGETTVKAWADSEKLTVTRLATGERQYDPAEVQALMNGEVPR
jgi:hypothetical protein